MLTLQLSDMMLSVDLATARVISLQIHGRERIHRPAPLFAFRLRDRAGNAVILGADNAADHIERTNGAVYTSFSLPDGSRLAELSVCITLDKAASGVSWRISVNNVPSLYFVEWVDFPMVNLPALAANHPRGHGGQILLPYNEGVLIEDADLREQTDFRHYDPEYPSLGCYSIFPNMMSSQMEAYLWEDAGLYVGAHDPSRAVKGIDFFRDQDGVTLQLRLFCGVDFGEDFANDYPIVWVPIDGRWESAAEIYRTWFEAHLPPRARRITDNPALPAWYEDSPLVISYPVRGIHDMDEMKPNALFPYTNALPMLDELRAATESRLLVLLMHWEGTAPWAPPYVWPPFGGEDNFKTFLEALHAKEDMLGVYCSGFGYTIQSNLIEAYNCSESYEREGLSAGMCAGPDGRVAISRICTGQRSGYDICPASEVGRKLLSDAYTPLFDSGIDYAQILDQNHGGGQYFCYSRDHGHPPAPGGWMTAHMQDMLGEWNRQAPTMLFGCESAAAEPFIGNLLLSDNRFELNYMIGKPVPLYAYLYHEYVRNFMGNQVCSNLRSREDTLCYRIAYSFSAGDCMTLVMTPNGDIMKNWGTRDFDNPPDKAMTLRFIRNLTRFYREKAKPYLYAGRMIAVSPVACADHAFSCEWVNHAFTLPSILSSAWETPDGRRARILVNPYEADAICTVDGQEIHVPGLDGVLLEL